VCHIVNPLGRTNKYTLVCKLYQAFLPDSRRVVYAFTGDLAFTERANLTTKWLRLAPVLRGVVRFLGLPILNQRSFGRFLINLYLILTYFQGKFNPNLI
jgi:hypothetical protein